MQYEEPNEFSHALIEKFKKMETQECEVEKYLRIWGMPTYYNHVNTCDKCIKIGKIKKLKQELINEEKEQVTDINADFPTRLGRYVKIKLIKFTLNKFTL